MTYQELINAGFSQQEVAEYYKPEREKLLSAGFTNIEVDQHLGIPVTETLFKPEESKFTPEQELGLMKSQIENELLQKDIDTTKARIKELEGQSAFSLLKEGVEEAFTKEEKINEEIPTQQLIEEEIPRAIVEQDATDINKFVEKFGDRLPQTADEFQELTGGRTDSQLTALMTSFGSQLPLTKFSELVMSSGEKEFRNQLAQKNKTATIGGSIAGSLSTLVFLGQSTGLSGSSLFMLHTALQDVPSVISGDMTVKELSINLAQAGVLGQVFKYTQLGQKHLAGKLAESFGAKATAVLSEVAGTTGVFSGVTLLDMGTQKLKGKEIDIGSAVQSGGLISLFHLIGMPKRLKSIKHDVAKVDKHIADLTSYLKENNIEYSNKDLKLYRKIFVRVNTRGSLEKAIKSLSKEEQAKFEKAKATTKDIVAISKKGGDVSTKAVKIEEIPKDTTQKPIVTQEQRNLNTTEVFTEKINQADQLLQDGDIGEAGDVLGDMFMAITGNQKEFKKFFKTEDGAKLKELYEQLDEQHTEAEKGLSKLDKGMIESDKKEKADALQKEEKLVEEEVKKAEEKEIVEKKTIFHGTAEIFDEFDIKKSADGTIWFTDNKNKIEKGEVSATGKGQIMERTIDENNLKLGGWEESDKFSTQELIEQGYDGLKLVDEDETTYQIFFPEKLELAQEITDEKPKETKESETAVVAEEKVKEEITKIDKIIETDVEQADKLMTALHEEYTEEQLATPEHEAVMTKLKEANDAKEETKPKEVEAEKPIEIKEEKALLEESKLEIYEIPVDEYVKLNPDKLTGDKNMLGRRLRDKHENAIVEAYKKGIKISENVLKDYKETIEAIEIEKPTPVEKKAPVTAPKEKVVAVTLTPQEETKMRKLRQRIHAVASVKGLSKTQLKEIVKDKTGWASTSALKQTVESLEKVLASVKRVRPRVINYKKVIRVSTENNIQTLKNNMIEKGEMTEEDFNKIVKSIIGYFSSDKVKPPKYVGRSQFITETQGKQIIKTMLDTVPIIKDRIAVDKALEETPALKKEIEKIDKTYKKVYRNKKAKVSSALDMRYFTDSLEKQTGVPFGRIWRNMRRKKHVLQIKVDDILHRLQTIAGAKDFKKILKNKDSIARIEQYVRSKSSKYIKEVPEAPIDLTATEKKMADEMIKTLKDFEGDVRYNRFYDWREYNKPIVNAPESELNKATKILETEGDEALREWLKGRSWGIIKSGYDIGEFLNPTVRGYKIKAGLRRKGFETRESIEFQEFERDILQRYASYVRQMIMKTELKPEVMAWQNAIKQNKDNFDNPRKVIGLLDRNLREILGQKEQPQLLEKILMKAYSQAARVIFLDLRKGIRNRFQNAAYYTGLEDILKSKKMTESELEYFNTYVSQEKGIRRDLLYQDYSINIPVISQLNQIADEINVMGRTDRWNRIEAFKWKLGAVKNAIKKYPNYKTDSEQFNKFIKKAKLADLTTTEIKQALKIGALEGDETMARFIAQAVTEKIHFLYERSDRAPMEQGNELVRVLSNLMTFRKGVLQRIILDFHKMTSKIERETRRGFGSKKRAVRSVIGMIVWSTLIGMIYQRITGDKRNPYDIRSMLTSFDMGGLATGAQEQLGEFGGDVLEAALYQDKKALARVVNTIPRINKSFLPFYDEMLYMIEGTTGYYNLDKAILKQIRSEFDKEYKAKPLSYYEKERDLIEKGQHMFFGTDKYRDENKKTVPTRKIRKTRTTRKRRDG